MGWRRNVGQRVPPALCSDRNPTTGQARRAALLLHKQRQRGGVTMKKVLLSHRADFAIAEKARQPERAKPLLDHARVMVGFAEKAPAPAVATAKTPAVYGRSCQCFPGPRQQFHHIFLGRRRRATLELDSLPQPRECPD